MMDQPGEGKKFLRVEATWHTTTEVEVPEDYEWDGSSLDSEWADQIDSGAAELVDWDVR